MIPFPLTSVLVATSAQQSNETTTTSNRRRVTTTAAGDIASRLPVEGHLSPNLLRAVISFRLHVAKVTILLRQKRITNSGAGDKDVVGRCDSLLAQMRIALSWLDRNLTKEAMLLEDSLIYVSMVTCIVTLQSTQLAVLSEGGMMNVLRDAVVALPALIGLPISADDGEDKKENVPCLGSATGFTNNATSELTLTLTQLGIMVFDIVQCFYAKASEKASSRRRLKTATQRRRHTVSDAGDKVDDLKRLLNSLVALGFRIDDEAPHGTAVDSGETETCRGRGGLAKWTRLVRGQLESVRDFLNAR